MKYAVISYWAVQVGDTRFWLYDTEKEAIEALDRLWKKVYNSALKDESFDQENSYHNECFGVVAWTDGEERYFEVVKQTEKEEVTIMA